MGRQAGLFAQVGQGPSHEIIRLGPSLAQFYRLYNGRMMNRLRARLGCLAAMFGCFAAAGTPTPAAAAEPPAAIIVFDGSASMWGSPTGEKKSKLLLAREAFRAGLDKAPAGLRLGLISFGHRRSGDCGDVEVQVKPATGSVARINGILETYNPRGRGPITQALRAAAKELGPASAPASVILVHDDLDNCQADPCTALADLQMAHPTVVVHVVSLAMKREDAQRMMCLTRPTGGTLAEAGNAQQISTAIEAALKLASTGLAGPRTPEAAASPPPAPAGKTGLQLFARLSADGAAIINPLRWKVRAAGQPDAPLLHERDAVVEFAELPPGRYEIEAQYGFVVARSTVEVVAGKVSPVTLALGAGSVQLLDPATPAAMLRDAIVTFTRTEPLPETVSMLRGFVPEIALAPGNYVLGVTAGPLRIERAVVVKAGERVKIDPLIAVGELDLQVVAAAGGPTLEGVRTTVFEDDPDAPQGRREIAPLQGHLARAVVGTGKGQFPSLAARFCGKHHPLQPRTHGLAAQGVGEKSPHVTGGGAQRALAPQQPAPT